ncbi:MFS transporter [Actinomyces glycerinitolerans]|uniref:Sugar (And other) transporter n=1 Tax=Actinomyces glycerinitolerans TaxID=1892869 RepID=A0A1M4RX21_9ACTO|nr:MFS transporter [Actinomyces glycerinitolerans]SHE24471.1 sugar (and other) transporter [Actinomyces glycerinitolerans]
MAHTPALTQPTDALPNAGARLDRLPTSRFHWSVYWMVAFGLLVGWSNAIGGLVLAVLAEIGWTDNSSSAIFSSLTTAGMFVGALVGGAIGDRLGRRNGFLGFVAFHIITMLVAAASPNMTFLIIVRVFMGMALGGLLTVLFASWTEYVPSRDRGSWSSRASFIGNWSYPICSLIASYLVGVVSPEANWRIQFIIPAVTSTIVLIIVWRLFPESPRWLESKGRYREANELLRKIEADVERQKGITLEPAADAVEEHAKTQGQVNLPYSALFKGELLKRVIVGSFALIAMNVIQYTLINWLPTMLLSQGIDLADSVVLNTMSMFGAPIGIFIAIFIIDRFPRRVFGIGLLLIIAVLGYVYSLQTSMTALSVVGFFLIIFVYMFVCFASAVYVPEIWPTAAKLRGSGLANSVGRVSGILSPYAVAALLDASGVTGVFILLGATAVVTAAVIAVFGVESRGASIESISNVDID